MQEYPYTFDAEACRECGGKCCRGESGYIWVNSQEIESIALFLGMPVEDFTRKYLRKVYDRYSLVELKIEGECVCVFFDLEKNNCSIYEARPGQCRRFPFWDYFKLKPEIAEKECPGVARKKIQ